MKTRILAASILICGFANAQSIDSSRFGASAAPWANTEGWSNFQDLCVHYMRFPIDLMQGAIVDNFFFQQYDALVASGQTYNVTMYGIVSPRKNGSQWTTATDFGDNFKLIVERYDGDGVNDMQGLIYPIKNWEICNEVMYDTMANTPNSPNYPMWSGFTKTMYLDFMSNAKTAMQDACSTCNLFNGSQLLPPSEFYPSIWDLTAPIPAGNGPDIIDAISYHVYHKDLSIDVALADFAAYNLQNKPIWVTEADMQGAYSLDTTLNQDDNPRLCIQSFVYALYRGVHKIIYTTMRAGTSDPLFVKWGSLLDPQTGAKRKIYYSYKKLIEKIDYFTNVVAASPNNNTTIFAYKFTVQNKPVYILWATAPQAVSLTLSNGSVTSVTTTESVPQDTLGYFTIQNIPASGGSVTLNLTTTPIYVEENFTTGINESSFNSVIQIYPNPTSGKFIIEMENVKSRLKNGVIEIYNVLGEKVYQSEIKNPKSEINLNVPNGIYFYQIRNGQQEIKNGKLIIQ